MSARSRGGGYIGSGVPHAFSYGAVEVVASVSNVQCISRTKRALRITLRKRMQAVRGGAKLSASAGNIVLSS